MDRLNILSLLGLSLRGGRLAVGEEPVEAAARARDARVLLLAADAAEGTRRRCEHSAQAGLYPDVAAPVLQAGLQAVRVGVGRVMVGVDRVDDALRVGEEIDSLLFRAGVIAAEAV